VIFPGAPWCRSTRAVASKGGLVPLMVIGKEFGKGLLDRIAK